MILCDANVPSPIGGIDGAIHLYNAQAVIVRSQQFRDQVGKSADRTGETKSVLATHSEQPQKRLMNRRRLDRKSTRLNSSH